MANHPGHCAPRRLGEPYAQYFARFKTWKENRDEECRAARWARLPTPESIDGDMDHMETDSNVDASTYGYLNTATTFGPGKHSPSPSPTHSPEPRRESAASRQALLTATSRPNPTHRKPVRKPRRSPQPSRPSDAAGIRKVSPRRLRSQSQRLSRAVTEFFELDSHGVPRAIADFQPSAS